MQTMKKTELNGNFAIALCHAQNFKGDGHLNNVFMSTGENNTVAWATDGYVGIKYTVAGDAIDSCDNGINLAGLNKRAIIAASANFVTMRDNVILIESVKNKKMTQSMAMVDMSRKPTVSINTLTQVIDDAKNSGQVFRIDATTWDAILRLWNTDHPDAMIVIDRDPNTGLRVGLCHKASTDIVMWYPLNLGVTDQLQRTYFSAKLFVKCIDGCKAMGNGTIDLCLQIDRLAPVAIVSWACDTVVMPVNLA